MQGPPGIPGDRGFAGPRGERVTEPCSQVIKKKSSLVLVSTCRVKMELLDRLDNQGHRDQE